MRINDLVGETTEYDKKLKVELRKPKSWCKSISAFANTLGGALIFGVSDENEIIGLDNPVKDAEKISEIIKTKLNPIPEFKMSFRKVEDNILIILEVFKGDETPYYYYNDGSLEAYIRIGNESVKASPTELQRLVLRGRNKSYDSHKSMYKIRDYSFSKLRERYKKWTGYSFDEKNLISFGLADEEGYLTIAGSLIVDDSPVHHSRLFCTRWNGLNKSSGVLDALDEAEYEGSVISLIENGEAFIKRNAKMMWRKTANSREEMPDYVERSYHEALVNAIAHRDYLIYGSEVHIDIYDDRMEIYSPGGMPDGSIIQDRDPLTVPSTQVEYDQLLFLGGMPDGSIIQDRDPLTVPSTRRNPVLADIFNRLGYMERKGSGFAKIIDNYAFQINYKEDKKPYFRSDRYQFTVIMPNLNYSDKKEDSLNDQNRTDDTINVQKGADDIINDTINIQKGDGDIINHQSDVKDEIELTMEEIKILEIMKNKPDITIKQLTVILSGISNRTITRNIVILKKKGLLERVGSRKKGYWKVKR